jgi:hypothetical protein
MIKSIQQELSANVSSAKDTVELRASRHEYWESWELYPQAARELAAELLEAAATAEAAWGISDSVAEENP